MVAEAVALRSGPQPDIVLELDLDGVIEGVTLSSAVPGEDIKEWIGRPWLETVVDSGSVKVSRIIDDARSAGVSGFRQINQIFPSGLELPFEFTTVRVGRKGFMAVGKSLKAVADLQSRLNAAQQVIERDYWKLRDVETRCRLLFDRSNEAVLMVRAADLRIVDANPASIRTLGLSFQSGKDGASRDLLSEIALDEQTALTAMLHRVRDEGKAPRILVHLGTDRRPWFIQASLLPSQEGLVYLIQFESISQRRQDEEDRVDVGTLIDRSPDSFATLDREGTILSVNQAFLDLVQIGHKDLVVGEQLGRWLGRPGADMTVLLSNIKRYGAVRIFSTTLQSEFGTSVEVEVSASSDGSPNPRYLGVLIRDVGSRLPESTDLGQLASNLGAFANRIGKTTLPRLVREAVGVVERHYIDSALELTGGNRTAAAQLLGVSRQSLYAKLNRYDIEGDPQTPSRIE